VLSKKELALTAAADTSDLQLGNGQSGSAGALGATSPGSSSLGPAEGLADESH
jgi:hypothetical protein